jgi:hypothetical protein
VLLVVCCVGVVVDGLFVWFCVVFGVCGGLGFVCGFVCGCCVGGCFGVGCYVVVLFWGLVGGVCVVF